MTQYQFNDINPDVETGTTLASDLNSWKAAVESGHSGSSRPVYIRAGMSWVNISSNPWKCYLFDGTDDVLIGLLDYSGNKFYSDTSSTSISSIAALRALKKEFASRVFVEGYYATGDGGGGHYYYDSSDTSSTDNGGTIVVATDGARWKLIHDGEVSAKQFGAKGDGVTDDTTALQQLLNSSVPRVYIPSGAYLTSALVVPSNIAYLSGDGKYSSVLKFKRQTYTSGQILLDISNNTSKGIEVSNFSVDCDDVIFKTYGTYAIVLNDSNNINANNLRIVGRGQSAITTNAMVNGRFLDITVDSTGSAGNSFHACFYGANCNNVIISNMKTTGLPEYSGVFGSGTVFSKFISCHTEGTSGGFGYSLGGCAFSHILNCTSKNTSHEAFQITDCYCCTINGNTAEWETGYGVDAGISINGQSGASGLTRLNKVINNTIINSYSSGLLCANNSQQNLFSGNLLRDCGVRGTAGGASGTSVACMGQYTDLTSVSCAGNSFKNNKIVNESGTVSYCFAEFNLGSGATLSSTVVLDNEIQSGSFGVSRYLFANTTSRNQDIDFQSFSPTILPASGSITSYTVNSAKFRRRLEGVEMTLDISITNAGTGAGGLTVLFNNSLINAAATSGILSGRENGVTGKCCVGICHSGGLVVVGADNSSIIATNARIIMSGMYRTA